mmetsp:Transcript_23745/g.21610  ORF Transcript_23745/g.21610 Transcript_23745/m.21610 type:complete len:237 (-) Transcript_23745:19-729(-)
MINIFDCLCHSIIIALPLSVLFAFYLLNKIKYSKIDNIRNVSTTAQLSNNDNSERQDVNINTSTNLETHLRNVMKCNSEVTCEHMKAIYDGDEIKYAGTLLKQGKRLKGWKMKRFVLKNSELSAYDLNNNDWKGSIMITRETIVEPLSPSFVKDKKFAFKIKSFNKVWVLQCMSNNDRDIWIDNLNICVRNSLVNNADIHSSRRYSDSHSSVSDELSISDHVEDFSKQRDSPKSLK